MFTLEQNKEIVVDFYDQAFDRNQPQEASAAYIGDTYLQHHPLVEDGADALSGHVKQLRSDFPNFRLDIKRVVAAANIRPARMRRAALVAASGSRAAAVLPAGASRVLLLRTAPVGDNTRSTPSTATGSCP